MSKPSKPFLPAIEPSQPRRLALATSAAFAGIALTSQHALAQGAGGTLGSRATTFAQDSLNWGAVATIVLYLVAAFAAITGLIGFWKLGRRTRQVSPMMPLCAFLAASIALGAGAWMAFASPTLIAPASRIPVAASQTIQFR